MKKNLLPKARPDLKPLVHQTKTQVLRDELLALVRTMQPDEKLPTMRRLQEMLAVSPMTLHRALSELEAHNHIYRRQGSGIYVAPKRPEKSGDRVLETASEAGIFTVGLVYDRDIFGFQSSPFGSILVEEARRRAEEKRERFSLYLSLPGAENSAIPVHDDLREDVENGRLRGVLYAGESNPRALQWLLQKRVPVVSLSYLPTETCRVKIDHSALVRLGVRALAEKGCRRIALWIPLGVGLGRRDGEKTFPELDAFRETLAELGLEFDENRVWRNAEHTDVIADTGHETNQAQGLRAARETFGQTRGKLRGAQNHNVQTQDKTPEIAANAGTSSTRNAPRVAFFNDTISGESVPGENVPDGIVSDDDMMTRGALTFLEQNGVRVGENLQIATHSNRNSDVLLGYKNDLLLLEIDPSNVAHAMFQTLETLIDGKEPAQRVVEIQPKLLA